MNPEERFLRAATRGLRGKARQAAQAELRSHIHERAGQLQLILGATAEAEARAQAIRELGAPAAIARGLRLTHRRWSAGLLMLSAPVLLASLLANAYSRGQTEVTQLINHVLFPSAHWVDPCQGRSACVALYSDGPLTPQDIRNAGLVPFSEARPLLERLGVQLHFHGLFQKTLGMPGEAALSVRPLMVKVGRLGKPGVTGGYLNVAEALLQGAQRDWPVRVDSASLQLHLGTWPVTPETQLGLRTIETYVTTELNRHLTPAVQAVALVQQVPGEPPLQARVWAFPALRSARPNWVKLPAPHPSQLYALVTFRHRHEQGPATWMPELTAMIVPTQHGRLSFPLLLSPEKRPEVNLTSSQGDFLAEIQAGRNAAVLLAVPGDLRPRKRLDVAPLRPGPLTADWLPHQQRQ